MRQLVPTVLDHLDPEAAYADARRRARHGRPWVLVNMIASIDGATALDGVSGGLGGSADRAVFGALRRLADVVLVGAETVRAERYGPPKRAGQRIVVVSRSGRGLDAASALFTSGAGLVAVPEDGPGLPAGIPVMRAGRGAVDLGALLRRIHDDLRAAVVLAEGGPGLNGQLLAGGLVDEWCLTLAPRLVGGDSPRVAAGAGPAEGGAWHLAHVLEEQGFLFLRYLRHPEAG